MININDYTKEKICYYKDEKYSVRDNGAIYRHKRIDKKKRPNDGFWTFGNPDMFHHGYMYFSGEPVHRIVATAFLGEAPGEQYVVDHIDTNRQNNRPENLRWLTKLENILLNEITRKKVEFICGSIENFLKNPRLLYNHEQEDANFSWMRSVTKEEANNTLKHWKQLINNEKIEHHSEKIGEWIFQSIKEKSSSITDCEPEEKPNYDDVFKLAHENYTKIQKTLPEKSQTRTLQLAPQESISNIEQMKEKEIQPKGKRLDRLDEYFRSLKEKEEKAKNEELDEIDEVNDELNDEPLNFRSFIVQSNMEESQVDSSALNISNNRSENSIIAINIFPFEYSCYDCGESNWAYFVKSVELINGEIHDVTSNLEFAFKPEVIEAVQKWTNEHTDPKNIFGEIKVRYSKTREESYVSFGCCHCDRLLGDFYYQDKVIDLIYVEDSERIFRVPIDAGKLEYQP